jgi:hypothetical protein
MIAKRQEINKKRAIVAALPSDVPYAIILVVLPA